MSDDGHVVVFTSQVPEYWEKAAVHPTGESLYGTGMGNAYSCISWSGYEYGPLHSFSKPPSMNNRG